VHFEQVEDNAKILASTNLVMANSARAYLVDARFVGANLSSPNLANSNSMRQV
jgi:uncharacterized protein YjbI with pentapeptide repeats